MGRLSRDKRDIFYRLAKSKGYRARSAFKLLQIDAEFGILSDVTRAVDLCAAPGSWSQVLTDVLYQDEQDLANATTPRIVAVDLQPMAPIEGVLTMQGDITSRDTALEIVSHFQGQRAQIVISDGAPDVTGLHDMDEYLQGQLLLAAMRITTHVLVPGGSFVAKIFRGRNCGFLYSQLRCLFERVSVAKPTSSRHSSMEAFVVCLGFKGEPYTNLPLDQGGFVDVGDLGKALEEQSKERGQSLPSTVVPFVWCGDCNNWYKDGQYIDADTNFPLEEDSNYEYIPPIAPPINPPYQEAVARAKKASANSK